MTLKEAQKKYPDATLACMTHKANAFKSTEEVIEYIRTTFRSPITILYAKVGKTRSRVIYARVANEET